MRTRKPILLHLPEKLVTDLDKTLVSNPPAFNYKKEYFFYVIHRLAVSFNSLKKDEEYASVNMKKMKAETVHKIGDYIRYLKNEGFILCDNQFIPNKKSLGYKINPEFVKGSVLIEVKPETLLFGKIIRPMRNKKTNYSRLEPYLQTMKNAFMKLDFDYAGALNWIENVTDEEKKFYYRTAIYQLQDERFRYFKRNQTNLRLDTNLTNLKSDLRNFMKGDYVCIDLKNAQPFLLSQILKMTLSLSNDIKIEAKKSSKPSSTNNDNIIINQYNQFISHNTIHYVLTLMCGVSVFDWFVLVDIIGVLNFLKIRFKADLKKNTNLSLFEKSVLRGTFYEDFMNEFEGKITRKEAKNIMFKVLFSQNVRYENGKPWYPFLEEKMKFKDQHPFVYDCACLMKQKDHTKLAIGLQQLESFIFIDTIAQMLVREGVTPFTIHDSVIVKQEHLIRTMEIIHQVFKKYFDVLPALGIENIFNYGGQVSSEEDVLKFVKDVDHMAKKHETLINSDVTT